MDYSKLTDENLVSLSQEKDVGATNEIFTRYKNFVRAIIRNKDLFLPDGDGEDLLQEGMLGLFNAVNTYNGSVQFKNYAYVCIERMLISAISKSNRDKNRALNDSVALDGEMLENMFKTVFDPESNYIASESIKEFDLVIKEELSSLEYSILNLYVKGYSYEEIGVKTGKNVKAIDNALQRIRNKIRSLRASGKITR